MKIFVLGLIIIWSTFVFADDGKDKIRQHAVDKNMTDETAELLYNIHHLQKQGMMIGQHNGAWMEERKDLNSHFFKLSGRQPAMVCYDFMFITNRRNKENSWHRVKEHEIRANIIAANRAGLYQTMCWHYNDPYIGKTFYVKDLPEEYGQNSFRSILKGGVNHEVYKKDLRKVAEFSLSIKDDSGKLIPFIFRPFHEFDGEWFWWGAPYNTPDEFKEVWRFTVEYLRDSLNVHNIIYAFSPDIRFESKEDYLVRYPGDEYTDIIGFDDYEDFKYDQKRTQKAKDRIKIVAEIGKEKNKPVALTELGYFVKHNQPKKKIDAERIKWMLKAVSEMNEYLAYIVFWGNGGTYDYCVPSEGLVGEKDFLDFLNQPFIIMNDNKEEKLKKE